MITGMSYLLVLRCLSYFDLLGRDPLTYSLFFCRLDILLLSSCDLLRLFHIWSTFEIYRVMIDAHWLQIACQKRYVVAAWTWEIHRPPILALLGLHLIVCKSERVVRWRLRVVPRNFNFIGFTLHIVAKLREDCWARLPKTLKILAIIRAPNWRRQQGACPSLVSLFRLGHGPSMRSLVVLHQGNYVRDVTHLYLFL